MRSVVEEAERVVLGSALLDDAACDLVVAVRSWAVPAHATIACALRELRARGMPVSVPVLRAALEDARSWDRVGGAAYLDACLDAASTAAAGGTLRLHDHLAVIARAGVDRDEERCAAGLAAALAAGDEDAVAHYRAELRRIAAERREVAHGRWADAVATVGVPSGRGVRLTMPQLGAYWGVMWPGQAAIVAGRTSVGKTALCAALALCWANDGVRVHVVSLEDTEREWAERFAATLSRVSIADLRRGVADPAAVDAASAYLRRIPLTVEHCAGYDPDRVATAVGAAVAGGARVVIIDYVQAIAWGNDGSEYAMLQHALGAIEHALGARACAVLGSQLARGEDRGATTSMHMLRGSGALEERARKVLLLHRRKEADTSTTCAGACVPLACVDVEVAKNKGPTGTVCGYVWTDWGVWWPGGEAPAWTQRAPEAQGNVQ